MINLPDDAPEPCRPDVENLARAENRLRQSKRPEEPRNVDFTLAEEYLPENFLISDIQSTTSRHLVFATNKQLQLLARCKTWYMDGTFKLVKKNLYQIFSIHGFISKDGHIKQVPLAYALMSQRRAIDYERVCKMYRYVLITVPTIL